MIKVKFCSSDVVKDVLLYCNTEDIRIVLSTFGNSFDGLIYPKGLSKNSSCMSEYKQVNDLVGMSENPIMTLPIKKRTVY